MPTIIRKNYKYFIISFLLIYLFGGRPAEFGEEQVFFHGFRIPQPVIRVGLGINLEDVFIQAASGMKIYQVDQSYKLMADDVNEVRIKGHKDLISEKFVVQVAQARKKEDAEESVRELKSKIGGRIYFIQNNEDNENGVFQVRVGDFLTRGDALAFIKKIAQEGVKDAWIIREEITEPESKPAWVLVNDELINLNDETALYFIPSSAESYLSYLGKSYRGILVLRGSRKGILLINILNVEDYLKGVVPGELSPYNFGELEAQKAQAIAARTYALKNVGQFKDLGFDVFATPASQVYEGMNIEHPLSTRAVESTAGEVAVYGGKLINALYTSTCGGATEDVENMFEGEPAPYLKSTECVMEQDDWLLRSATALPPIFVAGTNVGPKLAYLAALDVIPQDKNSAYFEERASSGEIVEWLRNALPLIGRETSLSSPEPRPLHLAGLAGLFHEAFEWQERAGNLVGRSDAERFSRDFPALKPEESASLAYLLTSGILPSAPETSDLNRTLTRAEAALYLAKAMSAYKDFWHQGYIKNWSKNKLELMEDEKTKMLELSPGLTLLRSMEESTSVVPSLSVEGGDVVKWIESDGKIRLLQVTVASNTRILDQSSQYHRWQTRVSVENLQDRINQFYPIGKLIDLVPQKRGPSKRVIEMSVIGQEGQVRVTGMKIRQALNLRDNLFVIDKEMDADGRVTHFIFTGKGWGHGVGLCQVGAYRMSQKGASSEEILKKYYRGIRLEKIY